MKRSLPAAARLAMAAMLLVPAIAIAADTSKPPEDLRELLALYGTDSQRLNQFVDGQPLGAPEQEPLLRAMVAVRRLKFAEIHAACHTTFPTAPMLRDTKPYRGEFFAFDGRIRRLTVERPEPAVADRFQLDHYYRCEIEAPGGEPAIVYALAVPVAWQPDQPLDARIGVRGLLLKRSAAEDQPPQPVFAAARVAWYPATPLGNLHFDVGLLDDVRDREPITNDESECFYALLAAAGRSAPGKLLDEAARDPIPPLFNEPAAQRGRLVGIRGTAIRAIPIHIDDPEIAATFGVERYFEVEVVNQDSHGYAMAFCVLDLPPEMQTGEQISVDVRGAGFYLKSWAYRPHSVANKGRPEGQKKLRLAPLLIGRELAFLPKPEHSHDLVNVVSLILLGLAIFGLALFAWRVRREDRHDRRLFTPTGPIEPPRHE